MVNLKGLLSLAAVTAFLLVMAARVDGEKKLSHPALTRGAALNMKVLYWYDRKAVANHCPHTVLYWFTFPVTPEGTVKCLSSTLKHCGQRSPT